MEKSPYTTVLGIPCPWCYKWQCSSFDDGEVYLEEDTNLVRCCCCDYSFGTLTSKEKSCDEIQTTGSVRGW